ncbi:nucleoside hydrolase [Rubinisphaera sp. JC750]|uniref:nucleoside hydrolase n=1 Tax=Rubinisphaera sp. JC750 TaxID=2898658 RepID=UPI001F28C460|nr:nucleoside hydrolase [Rubinisphaera sp. JC750]
MFDWLSIMNPMGGQPPLRVLLRCQLTSCSTPLSSESFIVRVLLNAFLCGYLCAVAANTAVASEPPRPTPLIFDTDIGNDCDDVLALGMIHALQSRGDCELLAVTITKDHELAAPFTDAVNTFYGRGHIPIGVCDSGVTPDAGRFNALARVEENGRLRYPHDLNSGEQAFAAVDLLRKTLAAAEDGSVSIAQVGFSTNLANLLESPADEHSSLPGRELVKKKVRLLSVMAGTFVPDKNRQAGLYNIVKDLPAAQKVVDSWPTPIVWSGYEIGKAVAYPHESVEEDYNYVEHHPLAEAYVRFSPPPHNRPTWDLTSVLYAVYPQRGYFDLSPAGQVTLAEDGFASFEPAEGGRDRFLQLNEVQAARVVESLVQLASQPPCTSGKEE